MRVSQNTLQKIYTDMETAELVKLLKTKELTDEASSIISETFAERGYLKKKYTKLKKNLKKNRIELIS